MRRFKDVRKEFERGSECLEGAQARNAQAPRGKQHEVEEASNALLNARRVFRSSALDYVLQVRLRELPPSFRKSSVSNRLPLAFADQRHRSQEEDRHPEGSEFIRRRVYVCLRRPQTLTAPLPVLCCYQMLSLMEAQSNFFQHGHQSLSELDGYRQTLNEEVGLSWWGRGLKTPVVAAGRRSSNRKCRRVCVSQFFEENIPTPSTSTVLTVKLSTNLKQEMNLSALASQNPEKPNKALPPQFRHRGHREFGTGSAKRSRLPRFLCQRRKRGLNSRFGFLSRFGKTVCDERV